MLHILLLILKIIGILLLVIVGIVLFAVISVLVVPVRYSADGSGYFNDSGRNFTGHALVSWFLHAVTVRLSYEENKLLVKVKVFFFTIYEMTMPEEGTQGGQSPGSWSSDTGQSTVTGSEETEKIPESAAGSETAAASAEKEESPPEEGGTAEETGVGEEEPEKEPEEITEDSPEETEAAEFGEEAKQSTGESRKKSREKNRAEKEKRPGLFEQILTGFNETMTKVFDRIGDMFDWLNRFLSGEIKIVPEDNAVTRLMDFWKDEENKATVRLVIAQVKKLFRHILPREAGGNIRAGFDDPAATGTMLAAIAPFTAFTERLFRSSRLLMRR